MEKLKIESEFPTFEVRSVPRKQKHLVKAKDSTIHLQLVVLDGWRGKGKVTHVRLSGKSMTPFIRDGDNMIVHHDVDHLQIGDIIVWKARHERGWIAHRIVHLQSNKRKRQTAIRTKGDMSTSLDRKLMGTERILGRVNHIEKTICSTKVQMNCRGLASRAIGIFSFAQGVLYHYSIVCNEMEFLPSDIPRFSLYIRFLPKSITNCLIHFLKIGICIVSYMALAWVLIKKCIGK